MGIYKKGKNYYIDYYSEGRRYRERVGPNKQLAEIVLSKRRVEIAEGKFLDKARPLPKITLAEMAAKFLEWSKANKLSWKTDFFSLKQLKPYFDGKNLPEISPFRIEGYKVKRVKEVSPRTVNIELACLKHLFSKAVLWGFAKDNPVKGVKLFKEDNARLRYLSLEEIQRLLNSCDDHLRPVILTALHTGMRRGEILKMKWEDVDFGNGMIRVPHSKNGDSRDIPMSETLSETMRQLKSEAGMCEYVFTALNGNEKPLKDIRNIFARALKKAGIENFRFHDLRHTFASHLVMAGVDLKTVQEYLGHRSFEMTLRYSHLSPSHKKRAIKIMDGVTDGHFLDTSDVLQKITKLV